MRNRCQSDHIIILLWSHDTDIYHHPLRIVPAPPGAQNLDPGAQKCDPRAHICAPPSSSLSPGHIFVTPGQVNVPLSNLKILHIILLCTYTNKNFCQFVNVRNSCQKVIKDKSIPTSDLSGSNNNVLPD